MLAATLASAAGSRLVEGCHGGIGGFDFSPSGRWIVYQRWVPQGQTPDCNGTVQLRLVRADGTDARTLVWRDDTGWYWAPHRDLLALLTPTSPENDAFRLHIVHARGGPVRVRARGREIRDVAWSPTGRWIALEQDGELVTGHLGEAGLYRLAAYPNGFSWSPDGRRIAYSTAPDSIRLSRPDGTAERVVTTGFWPHWSPDGRWLSFFRTVQGDELEAFVVHPDGSDLFSLGTGYCLDVRWAPDGRHLALQSGCYGFVEADPQATIIDLGRRVKSPLGIGRVVWNWSGKRLALYRRWTAPSLVLLDPDGDRRTLVTPFWFYGWSPRSAAFLLLTGHEIEIGRDDGTGRVRRFATGSYPRWSPGGRRIAFIQQQGHCGEVLLVKRVRGGGARPVTPCR